jgi:uncharacterized protein YkwD
MITLSRSHRFFTAFLFSILLFVPGFCSAQSNTSPILHPLIPAITSTPVQTPPPHSHAVVAHKSKSGNTPLAQTLYSHGNPTNEEQEELELINRARANPPAEGKRLDTASDISVVEDEQSFGSPTRSEVEAAYQAFPAVQPLAFNAKLIDAALAHSNDMLQHDFQSHTGTDGSDPGQRMDAAGYPASTSGWGENIFAYGEFPWDIMATFEYDFGNTPPGHRIALINYAGTIYAEIGLGMVDGGSGGGDVGPIVTTEDFSDDGSRFILGVVYDDKNHNGFYDEGEGLAGVTIKPSSGNYYAVTSSSGGYAVLYSGSGGVTVTASGGALQSPISRTVSFDVDNVKVDFTTAMSGIPGVTNLILPLADTTINRDSALFQWNKMAGATVYHLQVASDSLMKTLVLNDSILTDTSKLLIGLKDESSYFWRVRVKNTKGWGDFTPVQTFGVILPAPLVKLMSPANGAVEDTDINFAWHLDAPRVTNYWFQLADNKAMTNPIVSDSTDLYTYDTTEFVLLNTLTIPKTYYWTVQAQNDGGWNVLRSVDSFSTAFPASVSMLHADGHSFVTVSPNPTDGTVHLRFTLAQSAASSMKIYNALGECVSTILSGNLTPKEYDAIWDASSSPTGVYFYQLRAGSMNEVGRIVVAR